MSWNDNWVTQKWNQIFSKKTVRRLQKRQEWVKVKLSEGGSGSSVRVYCVTGRRFKFMSLNPDLVPREEDVKTKCKFKATGTSATFSLVVGANYYIVAYADGHRPAKYKIQYDMDSTSKQPHELSLDPDDDQTMAAEPSTRR